MRVLVRELVGAQVFYLSKTSTLPRSSMAAPLASSHSAKEKGSSTRRFVSGIHGGLAGMSDGIGFPAYVHRHVVFSIFAPVSVNISGGALFGFRVNFMPGPYQYRL